MTWYPFQSFLGPALAHLNWDEEQFWAATPNATWAALESWRRANCAPTDDDKKRDYLKWRKQFDEPKTNGADPGWIKGQPKWLQEWIEHDA